MENIFVDWNKSQETESRFLAPEFSFFTCYLAPAMQQQGSEKGGGGARLSLVRPATDGKGGLAGSVLRSPLGLGRRGKGVWEKDMEAEVDEGPGVGSVGEGGDPDGDYD